MGQFQAFQAQLCSREMDSISLLHKVTGVLLVPLVDQPASLLFEREQSCHHSALTSVGLAVAPAALLFVSMAGLLFRKWGDQFLAKPC